MAIDIGKLEDFLGAAVAAGTVVIGHRLGLYQALAAGPADAGDGLRVTADGATLPLTHGMQPSAGSAVMARPGLASEDS
jgi:hypothetical protein